MGKSMKCSQAFVDGSFNSKANVYGWAVLFMDHAGKKYILQGHGSKPGLIEMRNVAGELCAAKAAIKYARYLKQDCLIIHYDYEGIAKWATGMWKANKKATKSYKSFIDFVTNDKEQPLKLIFNHTKAHSGIWGNEIVDMLAKEACGLLDICKRAAG